MPAHALVIFAVGWFFYESPANGRVRNELYWLT